MKERNADLDDSFPMFNFTFVRMDIRAGSWRVDSRTRFSVV